ncbi:tRNA-dihydrouridine synthase [Candidatus Saccharibacteria bacterium]|nr:tRNA-dihydrouridine synthase [Candidatus Saccharibacteria bacterium]
MTIWEELPKPFFVLAPMEAVTDHVFRRVVSRAAAPDIYFSEFTNATGWVHAGEKAVAGRLTIHPDEGYPLIAQIWCSEPEDIAKLASYCKELGYKGIDLNMGCPAKTAVKNSGGSAMIKQPELAAEIIAAAKTAGLPISVKTRLGYSNVDEWDTWLRHLLHQDLAALTVHLRTKKEMSKVPAHWDLAVDIKKLRDEIAPNTLLIGNGDVANKTEAQKRVEETGVDGIMIGRGIFTNIFAFEETETKHTQTELLQLLNYHLDLFDADGSTKPYETLKRFFKIYIRDFPGSSDLRARLMESTDSTEARAILSTERT